MHSLQGRRRAPWIPTFLFEDIQMPRIRPPRSQWDRFVQDFDEALWEKHPEEVEECFVRENPQLMLLNPLDDAEDEEDTL